MFGSTEISETPQYNIPGEPVRLFIGDEFIETETGIGGELSEQKKKVPTEVFTRVTGYYRPVSAMHRGKKQEVKERKMFDVAKAN